MRFIDALQELVRGYNRSYHRAIRTRPVDVTSANEHVIYERLYAKRKLPKAVKFQFKAGDTVRISGSKHPFRREFFQRWSAEMFTVTKRWRQRDVNMYRIKDCAGEELKQAFYAPELIKVTESPEKLHKVERELEEKIENGQKMVRVQWQGWPPHCSTWVPKSSLRDI